MQLDLGLKTYTVNGVETKFNPTDENFLQRLYDTMEKIGKMNEEYQKSDNIFEAWKDFNDKTRNLIDELFGQGFSDGVFGDVNLFAFSEGMPLWAKLFEMIVNECDIKTKAEIDTFNKKVNKYTKKYTNKYAK